MATTTKNIGIAIAAQPKKPASTDAKSPFSGNVKLRGRQLTGTVVSVKMKNSAVVEWTRKKAVPKYERFEKRLSKIIAHVPAELKVSEGDVVKMSECRPLSKRKHFVIIENHGPEKGYAVKKEGRDASKQEKKVKPSPEEQPEQ